MLKRKAALHYATLSARDGAALPDVAAPNAACAFAVQLLSLKRPVPDGGAAHATTQRADRQAQRILEKIASREAEWARRSALDLQRLEDLEEREKRRRALALKQEWFVIGRVVAEAMRNDAFWRSRIMPLLEQAPLSRREKALLGMRQD